MFEEADGFVDGRRGGVFGQSVGGKVGGVLRSNTLAGNLACFGFLEVAADSRTGGNSLIDFSMEQVWGARGDTRP